MKNSAAAAVGDDRDLLYEDFGYRVGLLFGVYRRRCWYWCWYQCRYCCWCKKLKLLPW